VMLFCFVHKDTKRFKQFWIEQVNLSESIYESENPSDVALVRKVQQENARLFDNQVRELLQRGWVRP
jgi:hypothetical protein